MRPRLTAAEVQDLAAIEPNLFNLAHTLPGMRLEGAQLDPGTPIYDPSGEILFYRIPLRDECGGRLGYADVAAHTLFGAPLLATARIPHGMRTHGLQKHRPPSTACVANRVTIGKSSPTTTKFDSKTCRSVPREWERDDHVGTRHMGSCSFREPETQTDGAWHCDSETF